MKEKINVGYIGLGRRGMSMLRRQFSRMRDVEVTVLCDLSADRLEKGGEIVKEQSGVTPILTQDYRDILLRPEIDAVIVMTGWSGRPQIAKEAMEAGKYVAIEVGCADTLDECFDLIETYEKTGMPLMMLENCCYGRREMAVLRMVKEGLFGEIVHCRGGYFHYLNEVELFKNIGKEEIPHYRLPHYEARTRENYPTHELGPISKVLSINRGNRFVSLNAIASKACGIKAYAKEHFGEDSEYAKKDYLQGDVVNTVLRCANGETVLLTLDTTLPRAYYSRGFSVRGTRGMSDEERGVIFLEGMKEEIRDNEKEMYAQYDHPLHKEYESVGVQAGHGGMDWLVCRAFVESVKRGVNTPIDAYDTVTWMAIGALSEESIRCFGAPVDFPDFTSGRWRNREEIVEGKYCLDRVCVDPDTPILS